MRTYGRPKGTGKWQTVSTSSTGDNSNVMLTTLCQVLKLNLNESPIWANYGIPGVQSVLGQNFPDVFVQITQQQFAQYFAALSIVRSTAGTPGPNGEVEPTYLVTATTFSGSNLTATVF